MKVLLLVNKDIRDNICCSRSYMYGIMLKEYLEDLNVDVIINNFIYNGRRLNNSNIVKKIRYTNIDHIILIDRYGFSKKSLNYVKKLKEIAKNTVTSLAYSNKYKRDEDMIFFIENRGIKEGIYLNYFSNPQLCFPEGKKGIYILVDDNDDKIKDNIIKFAKDSMEYTNIIVKGIKGNMIYDYDMNGDRVNSIKINDYFKFYEIFRKIDFYFITDYVKDPVILADLSMCNTMIISKKGLITPKIIKLFDILETNNLIDWNNIIKKKNTFNIRDELIHNNMITDNVFANIYTYLTMNYDKRDIKEDIKEDTKKDIPKRIYLNDKLSESRKDVKNKNKKIHIMQNDLSAILLSKT